MPACYSTWIFNSLKWFILLGGGGEGDGEMGGCGREWEVVLVFITGCLQTRFLGACWWVFDYDLALMDWMEVKFLESDGYKELGISAIQLS